MGKYLIQLGVVWVGFSLVLGVVLVMGGQNKQLDMMRNNANNQTGSSKVIIQQVPEKGGDKGDTAAMRVDLPEMVATEVEVVK